MEVTGNLSTTSKFDWLFTVFWAQLLQTAYFNSMFQLHNDPKRWYNDHTHFADEKVVSERFSVLLSSHIELMVVDSKASLSSSGHLPFVLSFFWELTSSTLCSLLGV